MILCIKKSPVVKLRLNIMIKVNIPIMLTIHSDPSVLMFWKT